MAIADHFCDLWNCRKNRMSMCPLRLDDLISGFNPTSCSLATHIEGPFLAGRTPAIPVTFFWPWQLSRSLYTTVVRLRLPNTFMIIRHGFPPFLLGLGAWKGQKSTGGLTFKREEISEKLLKKPWRGSDFGVLEFFSVWLFCSI